MRLFICYFSKDGNLFFFWHLGIIKAITDNERVHPILQQAFWTGIPHLKNLFHSLSEATNTD